jgi:hypothetical protein
MNRFRVSLLAGVSAFALATASPAPAADLPVRPAPLKAPPAIQHKWMWWIEGGPSYLSGDPYVPGLTNPPFDVSAQGSGGEIAAGFDYLFDPGWHLSGQFRYSWYGPRSNSNNPVAVFQVPSDGGPITTAAQGSNSADRKEHRWLADFMVGRDLGIGIDTPVVGKFGVRIAEITGKTDGSALWTNLPLGAATLYRVNYTQRNSFLGIGPRIELDGALPLAPRWILRYMGGIDALYGRRKATQDVSVSQAGAAVPTTPTTILSGGPVNADASDYAWVLNADAMVGVSYAISARWSLMLSYRFDGYWRALKAFDSNGQSVSLDRFYHGVMLRLTMTR